MFFIPLLLFLSSHMLRRYESLVFILLMSLRCLFFWSKISLVWFCLCGLANFFVVWFLPFYLCVWYCFVSFYGNSSILLLLLSDIIFYPYFSCPVLSFLHIYVYVLLRYYLSIISPFVFSFSPPCTTRIQSFSISHK
jgi:hypothetical protein